VTYRNGLSAGYSRPTWVDTHAHLDDGRFDADRKAMLGRALEAGVTSIVTIGVDLPCSRAAIALAEQYEGIYATVGVQPNADELRPADKPRPVDKLCPGAYEAGESTYGTLRELLKHPRVVAVGEIGLDYYWDQSPRDVQQAALEGQLALAAEVSKPVVVHIRDKPGRTGAYEDALAILRAWISAHWNAATHRRSVGWSTDSAPSPGVLHCFSGTADVAHSALDLGFYLGVDGPVTYPNASARPLQALVAELPIDRLLLETDCPYLPPQAWRGKRNEPAYLPTIGAKVAKLKGIDILEVAKTTTANARRLFRLKPGER
jgi:TatD DNase family protein